MSVATTVLERRLDVEENQSAENAAVTDRDAMHNAMIGPIYRWLVNPDNSGPNPFKQDATNNEAAYTQQPAPAETAYTQPVTENTEVREQGITLIQNARADSYIFRSDSFVNQRSSEDVKSEASVMQDSDEEENEDLRPTSTTIQYKTESMKMNEAEGTITNQTAGKRISLSKRDKVVIAVVVAVIVALFVLIIVNSAIISGLNSELGTLQTSLSAAKANYSDMQGQVADYEKYLEETVKNLAQNMGMIR